MKIFFLCLGDALALYASLFLTLLLRYGNDFYWQFKESHAIPFSILFIVWIAVFYIAGLYDIRRLRNNLDFFKTLLLALSVNILLAIMFFYLTTVGIAPRTNLFIFAATFGIIELIWRRRFNEIAARGTARSKVVLAGTSRAASDIAEALASSPQLGYDLAAHIKDPANDAAAQKIRSAVAASGVCVAVVSRDIAHHPYLSEILYELFIRGIEVYDIPAFSERIMRKIPLKDVEENWFLEHMSSQPRFYDNLKRGLEILCATLLQIILLPLEALIALCIAVSSRGPIMYAQARIGAHGRAFTLYKFRTMKKDAEASGARWASPEDERVTPLGKILRHTHLDELPQLVNVIRGDLSFVGPRPERPEFVHRLEKEIPHYNIRLLVKPGITGWAQINYRYGASTEDAYQKLQYDVYYIKNRSLILDLAIILKTIKSFFINHA